LLVVLLAEIAAVGHRHHQELAYDRGDALEVAGPEGAAQAVGQLRHRHGRELRAGIHLLGAGHIGYAATGGLEFGEVARLIARIGGEILVGTKLAGIDEDRSHRNVTTIKCALHQAGMALMQRAHGGNHADGATRGTEFADRTTQIGDGSHDGKSLHAVCSFNCQRLLDAARRHRRRMIRTR